VTFLDYCVHENIDYNDGQNSSGSVLKCFVNVSAEGNTEGAFVQVYAECSTPSHSWAGWILRMYDRKLRRRTKQECRCNRCSVSAWFLSLFYINAIGAVGWATGRLVELAAAISKGFRWGSW